jgi:trans-2,3-dihydro-3-hydroxyanthranilate isomerase
MTRAAQALDAAVTELPLDVDWTNRGSQELHRYFVVDVFTAEPLAGNQLGVFADGRPFSAEQMQRLAREMNFAETTFVLPSKQGAEALIRIFTPANELPFAGHPVLGSAFVVGTALGLASVVLETGVGLVPIELEREDDRVVFGWMEQPLPSWEQYQHESELLAALGVACSGLPVEAYRNGPMHVYVELEGEEAVAALAPDFAALAGLPAATVNCFAGAGRRWKTRMFAPALGVPEDPATGSAAGPLAVHLARHGRILFGDEIEICQGAEIQRSSVLYARAEGSSDRLEQVAVGGCAVIVARGEFRLS